MALRLRIFATHPVQYHVPLWRALAAHPELDVKVLYFSDQGIRNSVDKGFGVPVRWDIDLLSGYESEFVSRDGELENWTSMRLPHPDRLLSQERPDWILVSGYTYSFQRQLQRRAKKAGARIAMRGEFCDLSYGPRNLVKVLARNLYLRWFYAPVDSFCYPGEMGREHLLNHGVAKDKMFFSPYSVDDSLIEAQQRGVTQAEAREALGIPDDRFMFVFSGKLIPRKDPMAVLDAMSRMRGLEKIGLIVLGDGELRPDFEAKARGLLGGRLIMPGFVNQSQLGRYFLAADAMLLPSLHETWGLVVNEAMHFGLPAIVSSQVGCHPNLVRSGETGYVYPAGDVHALAQQMQAIAADRASAQAMGKRATELMQDYRIDASARGVFEALGVGISPR